MIDKKNKMECTSMVTRSTLQDIPKTKLHPTSRLDVILISVHCELQASSNKNTCFAVFHILNMHLMASHLKFLSEVTSHLILKLDRVYQVPLHVMTCL